MTTDTPTPGSSAASFVQGDVATITATGDQAGGTFEWIGTDNPAIHTNVATFTATAAAESHYVGVKYTLNGVTQYAEPVLIEVQKLTVTVTATPNPNPAVIGGVVDLKAVSVPNDAGTTYEWTTVTNPLAANDPLDFHFAERNPNNIALFQSMQARNVVVYMTCKLRGATAKDYTSVSVEGYPAVNLTAIPAKVLVGQTSTLSAVGIPAGGVYTFTSDPVAVITQTGTSGDATLILS